MKLLLPRNLLKQWHALGNGTSWNVNRRREDVLMETEMRQEFIRSNGLRSVFPEQLGLGSAVCLEGTAFLHKYCSNLAPMPK